MTHDSDEWREICEAVAQRNWAAVDEVLETQAARSTRPSRYGYDDTKATILQQSRNKYKSTVYSSELLR